MNHLKIAFLLFGILSIIMFSEAQIPGLVSNPFGIKNEEIGLSPYIIGGDTVSQNLPYMAHLGIDDHVCAGVIIHKSYILTSASCFLSTSEKSKITVILGKRNLSPTTTSTTALSTSTLSTSTLSTSTLSTTASSPITTTTNSPTTMTTPSPNQPQIVELKNVIIHPDFNAYHSDIALIKLPNELQFSDTVKAIDLPKRRQRFPRAFNLKTGTISGWGSIRNSPYSESVTELRSAKAVIIGPFACRMTIKKARIDYGVDNKEVCTRAEYKKNYVGTCDGDEGGPLTAEVREKKVKKTVLVGIAKPPITDNCKFLSVFTYVGSFLDWIADTTKMEIPF